MTMPVIGRLFVCVRCGERVLVTELPREHLEPAEFVCGKCLEKKSA